MPGFQGLDRHRLWYTPPMATPRSLGKGTYGLERFNGERDEIVAAVERRVVEARVAAAQLGEQQSLEYVLNEVAFAEIRRYENVRSKEGRRKLQRWRDLAQGLGRMRPKDKHDKLETFVHMYASDIAGHFNPTVYRSTIGLLPPALSLLLAPIRSARDGMSALGELETQIHLRGPIDVVRDAASRGTLVFTPTHSSNLDSIAIGFGLARGGLPPATYGAGKNLFSNPLVSFFMRNLGAYQVDRRLQFSLYKEVLKEYSTVLLERGYHSLFFPGGTRSRSNRVEQRLKLGLLGTTISAYRNSVERSGHSARRIYIVPVTINYRIVLEAETLIDDYLAEAGRSRYIIEDDEFSRVGRVIEFMRKLMAHESAVILRFGQPIDVLGNDVDDQGESLDAHGRRIDPSTYFRDADGVVSKDAQRDAVYTRGLGKVLASAFLRETVFVTTPLVCRATLDAIHARTGITDIYRLHRLPPSAALVPLQEVRSRAARLRARVADRPKWGRLTETVGAMTPQELVNDALGVLSSYHTRPVIERMGESVQVGSMTLLYYYANRTSHIPGEGAA